MFFRAPDQHRDTIMFEINAYVQYYQLDNIFKNIKKPNLYLTIQNYG